MGSHRPASAAQAAAGRHRIATSVQAVAGPTHRRVQRAKHQLASRRNAKPPRLLMSAVGVSLAAAPWAAIPLAFNGHPAQGAASAQSSPTANAAQPSYPPLVVVPFSSPPIATSVRASVLSSAGVTTSAAASPAPQWLINSQLREPASASGAMSLVSPALLDSLTATGIPRRALAAYINAAGAEDKVVPSCGLSWEVLAGIGYIESDHARSGGSSNPNWDGVANPPIYGPLLDGSDGYPAIKDTDGGVLDGNASYDRAVGPMQFLPSTWREYEEASSGLPDPQNIDDATLTSARYLCATGSDLRTANGLIAAVYGYNHSLDYVAAVVSVAIRYSGGDLPGGTPALNELPALAQTAANLPTPSAQPTVPEPSPMPSPSSSPSLAALPAPSATPSQTLAPTASQTPQPSPSPTPYPWSTDAPQTTTPVASPTPPSSSSPSVPASSPAAVTPAPPPDPSPSPTAAAPTGIIDSSQSAVQPDAAAQPEAS